MEKSLPTVEEINLLPLVLETLPVGVWIVDAGGRIVHGNPAGRRTWAGARYVDGLLPICASCRRLRDGKGKWNNVESYLRERTGTEFSHGH